ncbi:hypothetical protein BURPS305_7706 [Burkholderia pseudomallei 305]|nr:hypothetical protein BURPS305_7706 [Burkholderia pseudomallei 305]
MNAAMCATSQKRDVGNGKGPRCFRIAALESVGAGEKTRTSDLRITNALLYQLSYTGNREMRL